MKIVDQVRLDIRKLVDDRNLRPGDRLPTEAEIAQLYGVARSTVREALKRLEHEGLFHAVQGNGRFLSAIGSLSVERPITKYESITSMLEELGYAVTNAVLEVGEVSSTQAEAVALGIEAGDPVIRLTRLRYGNDRPMVFSVNTILREALPGAVVHRDWTGSVTAALDAQGWAINSSAAQISAVTLPEDVESRYQLGGLGAWLLVVETCLTVDGTRVLFAQDYHRGSEIAFNVLRRR
ncbi:GntR family transcriptional regulator [Rathayibacter soli]|uniref:GntR family transcriptional regulator n=1 Tax=Rathayibacter soli TaxID=3144168 RepID=UPI0027E43CDD|nr:GntR family transcriptional regulator [Glaciibacter superstes]